MDLVVLGSAGSYPTPETGPCSGYLIRTDETLLWVDCGHGTFLELQRHCRPEDLAAVIISHEHPDHCVDLTNLYIRLRYGLGRSGMPVLAPAGVQRALRAFLPHGDATFDWNVLGDGDVAVVNDVELRCSRTDHSVETLAVELEDAAGTRLIYTADTGNGWSPSAFGRAPDLLLAEATWLAEAKSWAGHLSAAEAGVAGRECAARALMLTHRAAGTAREPWLSEAAASFGAPVLEARAGDVVAVGGR